MVQRLEKGDLQWENNYVHVYWCYESRDICTGLSQ